MWVIHQQQKIDKPFADYYADEMNKIIEHFKTKIKKDEDR